MTEAFHLPQYNVVIDKIRMGIDKLSAIVEKLPGLARTALDHWYIPGFVVEAVTDLVTKVAGIFRHVCRYIIDIVRGAAAPIKFLVDSFTWGDIHGQASKISGALAVAHQGEIDRWSGEGADAYRKTLGRHQTAVARIGAIANEVRTILYICAGAGLAFYVAVGGIVLKFLVVLTAAVAAIATGVFSIPALVVAIADAGITLGLLGTLVGSLTIFLGAQAQAASMAHNLTVDEEGFPGGRWP